jgi:hypothetical protein
MDQEQNHILYTVTTIAIISLKAAHILMNMYLVYMNIMYNIFNCTRFSRYYMGYQHAP